VVGDPIRHLVEILSRVFRFLFHVLINIDDCRYESLLASEDGRFLNVSTML